MLYYFNVHIPRGCTEGVWNQGYDALNMNSTSYFLARINKDYTNDITNPWFKDLGFAKKGQLFYFKLSIKSSCIFDYALLY